MSRSDKIPRAAALRYEGDAAPPLIVASGMGQAASQILQIAEDCDIPVYRDHALGTLLSQFEAGSSLPEPLFDAVSDILALVFTLAGDESPETNP